jgi:hypothetical protein
MREEEETTFEQFEVGGFTASPEAPKTIGSSKKHSTCYQPAFSGLLSPFRVVTDVAQFSLLDYLQGHCRSFTQIDRAAHLRSDEQGLESRDGKGEREKSRGRRKRNWIRDLQRSVVGYPITNDARG